jgi:uncharacterized membrane protein
MRRPIQTASEGTSRIEAFSDGVFAIAITLLVLDIHVPEVKDGESLTQALMSKWETYLAFLIGFFTLLVCWINHHFMFEYITRKNDILLLLNGFKLLVVSFTPFATALISKYIGTGHQQTTISIYACNFFLMGTAMTSLWVYSAKADLISMDLPTIKAASRLYIFASLFSGAIFIISFFSVPVSLVLFGVMFLVFVFPKDRIHRLVRKEKEDAEQRQLKVADEKAANKKQLQEY